MLLVVLHLGVSLWIFPAGARGGVQADSLFHTGVQFYADGGYDKAIKVLEEALTLGVAPEIVYYLGCSYGGANRFKEARGNLEMAVDLQPSNIKYRFQLAKLLSQSGLSQAAEAQYLMVAQLDSQYTPALAALGLIANGRRDYQRAADLFTRVVHRNPYDYIGYYHLGSALVDLGKVDSAMGFLSTCATLNPGFVPAFMLLASVSFKKEEYEEALRLYEIAGSLDPENADTRYKIGVCQEKLKAYSNAIASFQRAASIDSLNVLYFAHLGQAYFQVGRFDSSVISYQLAAYIDDDNPSIFLNIALAWDRLDSTQRAIHAFNRAIEAHHPERIARVHDALGALLFNRKRFRDARKEYNLALRLLPTDLDALYYLSVSSEQIRDTPAARDGYRKFLRLATGIPTERARVDFARRRLRQLGQ